MSGVTTGGRTPGVYASSSDRRRNSRRDFALASVAGGIALLAYIMTLAPSVETNDAGRFQISAPLLGTGHPTGYPTFILIGKLFTFLPFGDVAYRVNLVGAVFGAISIALAFLVMRRLGAGGFVSFGAALLFGFTSTYWSQATLAEVYTMHVAFLFAVLLCLFGWRDTGGTWYLVGAGIISGLALGNNAGMVLFAPAFLVLMLAGRADFLSARKFVFGVVGFLAGLSVYAYIPLRGFSGAWANYGDEISNWSDVFALISGARFRGLMDASPSQLISGSGDFLAAFASQTTSPFGYILAVVLFLGALLGAASLLAGDSVVGVAMLLGGGAALFYALSYRIDDISVYYIPVYAVMVLLFAVGFGNTSGSRAVWTAAVPAIIAAMVFGLNFTGADRSGDYTQRETAEQILGQLPNDAILYGKIGLLPVTYLSEVEGTRPDVSLRWLDGGTLEEDFDRDLASGRPVYFISNPADDETYLPAVEDVAEPETEGPLIRLTPR